MPCPVCNIPEEGAAPRMPDGFRTKIRSSLWFAMVSLFVENAASQWLRQRGRAPDRDVERLGVAPVMAQLNNRGGG
jgi:hypothetical protein